MSRLRCTLVSLALLGACGGSTEPTPVDNGVPVSPVGSYSLIDSVVGGVTSPASGTIVVSATAAESTYVWTGTGPKRAGRWKGPLVELTFIDTLASFVTVWRGTATGSQMTFGALNQSVIYHFKRK